MKEQIIIALKAVGVLTFLLGIIYPLCITEISHICFHQKANGSLIEKDGTIIGSKFIGQPFDSIVYFMPRPSAVDYGTLPSGASNLSYTNKQLYEQMLVRKQEFITCNDLDSAQVVPSEMLFASASGLDPHISPEAALLQIDRIVKARNFSTRQIQSLHSKVEQSIERPQFGLFGERRVNVLELNLWLDEMSSSR